MLGAVTSMYEACHKPVGGLSQAYHRPNTGLTCWGLSQACGWPVTSLWEASQPLCKACARPVQGLACCKPVTGLQQTPPQIPLFMAETKGLWWPVGGM